MPGSSSSSVVQKFSIVSTCAHSFRCWRVVMFKRSSGGTESGATSTGGSAPDVASTGAGGLAGDSAPAGCFGGCVSASPNSIFA